MNYQMPGQVPPGQVDPQMIQHPTQMQQAFDPRGIQGALARGTNVYAGGLPAAPGAGRPRNAQISLGQGPLTPAMVEALQRRMQQYGTDSNNRQATVA